MNFDDEALMAYVDGELDADVRAAIAAACAADAVTANRGEAQRWLRHRVGGAFRPILDEPVPQRLRSLLLGVWIGRQWPSDHGGWVQAQPDHLAARGALVNALDTAPSGTTTPGPVTMTMSFVSRDGRHCQSFNAGPAADLAGLACRGADGWCIEALTHATRSTLTELRMAATPLPEPLLRQIDALIDGSPLDADAEQAAVAKQWQPPKQSPR